MITVEKNNGAVIIIIHGNISIGLTPAWAAELASQLKQVLEPAGKLASRLGYKHDVREQLGAS
jgi:hypothetical protein